MTGPRLEVVETIEIQTKADGSFNASTEFNPEKWLVVWNVKRELFARLLEPSDTVISGSLDIDGAGGQPSNDQKDDLVLKSNELTSLGEWWIDPNGKNRVVTKGTMNPVLNEGKLVIEVSIKA